MIWKSCEKNLEQSKFEAKFGVKKYESSKYFFSMQRYEPRKIIQGRAVIAPGPGWKNGECRCKNERVLQVGQNVPISGFLSTRNPMEVWGSFLVCWRPNFRMCETFLFCVLDGSKQHEGPGARLARYLEVVWEWLVQCVRKCILPNFVFCTSENNKKEEKGRVWESNIFVCAPFLTVKVVFERKLVSLADDQASCFEKRRRVRHAVRAQKTAKMHTFPCFSFFCRWTSECSRPLRHPTEKAEQGCAFVCVFCICLCIDSVGICRSCLEPLAGNMKCTVSLSLVFFLYFCVQCGLRFFCAIFFAKKTQKNKKTSPAKTLTYIFSGHFLRLETALFDTFCGNTFMWL